MATKDWKKVDTNKWSKKSGIELSIHKRTSDGKYNIIKSHLNGDFSQIKEEPTKTKAMVFAKAYMRKH